MLKNVFAIAEASGVSLFASLRSKPLYTGPTTIVTDRDRRETVRHLDRGLKELERRLSPDMTVIDVQLLVQVVGAGSYDEFRTGRAKAWRKQGQRYDCHAWPKALDTQGIAALLLPISAGRVGVAVGKHPRVVADPLFSSNHLATSQAPHDICLSLIASWICNPADGMTARLAPPVIEVIQGGRVQRRAAETFGLDGWPLPLADGL
jgi:hypothetical protein